MSNEMPNPGSKAAIAQGCTCPVMDNNRGAGVPNGHGNPPVFWYSSDCTVHTKGFDLK
jgi:hypothetical protein